MGESGEATPLRKKWAIPAAVLAVLIVVFCLVSGSEYVLLSADSVRGVLVVCMTAIGCAMVAEFTMRDRYRVVVAFVGGLCLLILVGSYILSYNPTYMAASYWLGVADTTVFFLVFALLAVKEKLPKLGVSEQTDSRKREIWNAFQKWTQLPVIRFRDQQDTLPLAEKPPELAFEIDECLKNHYPAIWDDLEELRQQYHAWKNEDVPKRFLKVENGQATIDLRYVNAYNDSMCNKLLAQHGQLAEQVKIEILDKHYTRLRC